MSRWSSRKLFLISGIALIIGCIFFGVQLVRLSKNAKKQFGLTPISMYQLITDGEAMVNSTDGRVNILLLGVGGGDHEGPDLTDTIIVLSFHLSDKTLSLISIPRDTWSDTLQDRINSAYHYGGLPLSSTVMEDVVGLPIHYVMVVDFSQFETLIDFIGGIDVNVPTAFTDAEYPIRGKENDDCGGDYTLACRYQTVTFEKGLQHMDGKRALMYVRSRHSEGEEGNDFARGRRQQDVIVAVKTKILSLQPWYHPELSMKLFQSFDQATKTNLTVSQILALAKLSMGITPDKIRKISIEPYLTEIPVETYGRYALEPKESFEKIHEFIQSSL